MFFLYFQERLSLGEALWLEAVYYTAFVVVEIPSGYFSDRIGRRLTLILGAALSAVGAVVFAVGDGFAAWAVGQLLFAAGFAFDSGTDSSLLYDSLAAEGRESEFRAREAHAASQSLGAVALSSLVGGFLGGIDLRLVYVATAACVGFAAVLAARFEEPPRIRAGSPSVQLRAVWAALSDPVLKWTVAAALTGTVLNHVPYEFLQPWLSELVGDATRTPIWAGTLAFVIVGISAMTAGGSDALAERIGPERVVLGALALQTVVIGLLGLWVAWWLVPVALLRGIPGAVMRPVLGSLQHPRLDSAVRATTLSVQSLAGRLTFGLSLVLAGTAAHTGMFALLRGYAVLGLVMVAVLVVARPRGDRGA